MRTSTTHRPPRIHSIVGKIVISLQRNSTARTPIGGGISQLDLHQAPITSCILARSAHEHITNIRSWWIPVTISTECRLRLLQFKFAASYLLQSRSIATRPISFKTSLVLLIVGPFYARGQFWLTSECTTRAILGRKGKFVLYRFSALRHATSIQSSKAEG